MKVCNKCGVLKDESEFSKNSKAKDGLQIWCKSCKREHHVKYYENNKHVWARNEARMLEKSRAYILELFKAGCADCGTTDPRVLTFDHTEDNKRANISNLMKNGLNVLKKEIAKCEIVCANCHMIRTGNRGNWWRNNHAPIV